MKHAGPVLIVALLLIAVGPLVAEAQYGPTVLYNFTLLPEDLTNPQPLTISDFTFGGELRVKLLIFQITSLGLVSPGWRTAEVVRPALLELLVNAGLAFDILFLRISAGLGPAFGLYAGDGRTELMRIGSNARVAADLRLGDLSLSLFYLLGLDSAFYDLGELLEVDVGKGYFGVAVLFPL